MPRSSSVTYTFVWENVKLLATGPVEAKLYMKPYWDRGTKVCSTGTCHMTRMAAVSIYGKNPSKTFFSGTNRLIAMNLL